MVSFQKSGCLVYSHGWCQPWNLELIRRGFVIIHPQKLTCKLKCPLGKEKNIDPKHQFLGSSRSSSGVCTLCTLNRHGQTTSPSDSYMTANHRLAPVFLDFFVYPEALMIAPWSFQQFLVPTKNFTRWAPTSYKWSFKPYKWPYKLVTGVIILLIGVINLFITGRGPPCRLPKGGGVFKGEGVYKWDGSLQNLKGTIGNYIEDIGILPSCTHTHTHP